MSCMIVRWIGTLLTFYTEKPSYVVLLVNTSSNTERLEKDFWVYYAFVSCLTMCVEKTFILLAHISWKKVKFSQD